MATWQDTADGHYCTRHDYAFTRGTVCHQCVVDPGATDTGLEQDEAEVSALRARVAEYQSRSRMCWSEAERLRKDDRQGQLAVKWSDAATKWARLAEERQDKIDEYARDDRLVRKAEKLAGVSN